MEKTKNSMFVFNTPSVDNCHGWKLGEYLAMGKAIISTPISNQLPEKLMHAENIHIIKTTKELGEAIDLLMKNRKYREKLENGATQYFYKYAKPKSVIEYIMKNIK